MLISSVTGRVALLSALAAASALALVVACSSDGGGAAVVAASDTGARDDAPAAEAASADAEVDAAPDGALRRDVRQRAHRGLRAGFDGVVHAVQTPRDTSCAMPDKDHVVVQVLMEGAVYRMVVNLVSDLGGADTKVRVASFPHALPAPEYAEGWRTGVPLDYANILGAHSGDAGFAPLTQDEAVAKIVAEVRVGDPVSVYCAQRPGPGRERGAHLPERPGQERGRRDRRRTDLRLPEVPAVSLRRSDVLNELGDCR